MDLLTLGTGRTKRNVSIGSDIDVRAQQTVFVIDEDPAFLERLSALFGSEQVTARVAPHPNLMMSKLEGERPSLIVCEIRRGSLTAFDFVTALSRSALADVPVLMVSHETDSSIGLRAFEAGAADFVCAPFDPREVVMRARVHLRQAARMHALSQLAHIDELTGIFNRRGLSVQLGKAVARAVRDGAPLSLLLIDLDGFKRINDEHGHAAGDQILRDVAIQLGAAVREDDVVARLGGDEFVVLLPNTHALLAQQVSDRIHRSLTIAASIGIASPDEERFDPDRLLRQADELMYAAKRRRKRDRLEMASI